MADELSDRVAAWLTQSGFPLEMRIAAKLEKAGFEVTQSVYYVDPETAAARETDIVAYKENVTKDAWIRFFAIVECKAGREAPWVFFPRRGSAPTPRSRVLSLAASTTTIPYLSRISARLDVRELPAFTSARPTAYGMVQAIKEKPDHAYASQMSVAKAPAVLLDEVGGNSGANDSFEIVWPIIITDAPLFEAHLSAD